MAKPQGGSGGGGGDAQTVRNGVIVGGAVLAGLGGGMVIGGLTGAAEIVGFLGGAALAVGIGLVILGGTGVIGGSPGGQDSGGGLPGCFVEGTQVLMADMTQKSIEHISVNDMVLSRHQKTGVVAGRQVREVFVHDVDSTLNFTLSSGEVLGTTAAHRFALGVNDFSAAGTIGVGAKLCTAASDTELIQREVIHAKARVYNFAVDEFRTYFVGRDRVWVHNLKKSDPPDPDEDP
jgi:hypothetical protein